MEWKGSVYRAKSGATGAMADFTDITTVTAFAAIFTSVGISKNTIIKPDAAIEVKLNSTDNDLFSIGANEKFECSWLNVSKIFIKVAGGANVFIMTAGQ